MKLLCYTTEGDAHLPPLVPGQTDRKWMDDFGDRHPYRCLPMVVANTTGWDILSPYSFTAWWTGGPSMDDIQIRADDGTAPEVLNRTVTSHFTRGVLTFHTGYLFRTEPGWDLWTGGSPNHVKDGIQALSGIVETDWLPFPFTMNWHFTRPGYISFKKDEPFCFIMPVPHNGYEDVQPVVKKLVEETPLLANASWDWGGGDFETPLQAAAHTGRRAIAEYLLSKNARIEIYAAAMLGQLDFVKAVLALNPQAHEIPGPHGFTLLHCAKQGGELAKPVYNWLVASGVPEVFQRPLPYIWPEGTAPKPA